MLLSSSPVSVSYSTPSRSSYYSARSHQPKNSSPLASPSHSSPTHHLQERRRAQYKSTTPASCRSPLPSLQVSGNLLFRTSNRTPVDPKKTFLRDRLQARCREHAQKLRERAVGSRRSSDRCSDVFMDYDDEDESDDVIMQDELFRRIMQSTNHKTKYSYRVSYALEVGSSFDPDLDDASVWESELQGKLCRASPVTSTHSVLDHTPSGNEATPDELEEEELREYAALADFADLDDLDLSNDDWTALSDADDLYLPHEASRQTRQPDTSDMDMS